jgi:hypothetical protein
LVETFVETAPARVGPFDILMVDRYAPSMLTGVDKKPWAEADLEEWDWA